MNLLRELPFEYIQNSPLIDDRYKLLFKLGTGRYSKYIFSHSRVRMAICTKTGQRVAIKIMNTLPETENEECEIVKYDNKAVKLFLN